MITNLQKQSIFLVATIAATIMVSSLTMAQGGHFRYEVTIVNISKQILSPAVVASHRSAMAPIFKVGEPASTELAGVAEDAMLDPMISALSSSPHVIEVVTLTGVAGPILPGETASVVIDAGNRLHFSRISLVGMLVTTNDAFYGLSSVLPASYRRVMTYFSPAYDAGSEFNSENCDFIPGPPCNNGGVHDPAEAEGFVYVHSGIHGIEDLVPSQHDWRNPVAKITVKLIR